MDENGFLRCENGLCSDGRYDEWCDECEIDRMIIEGRDDFLGQWSLYVKEDEPCDRFDVLNGMKTEFGITWYNRR